jgi:galactose oxidase-like protein
MGHASHARRPSLPWTGFKKVLAIVMMLQLTPLGASGAPRSQTGYWISAGNLGFSGTHVAVLREPQSNAAKVFLFGETGSPQTMRFWRFFASDNLAQAPAPAGLEIIPHPNSTAEDLFCSGHATLPDGKMLLMGGSYIPAEPCREVYTLNPAWNPGSGTPWSDNAAMAVERWYGTATILSSGQILASAGSMSSALIGFGGLAQGATMDTTWRVLQPLQLAARAWWSDTTAFPLTASGVGPSPLNHRDDYTLGRYPPGREGHVFLGDAIGRGILYGGRTRLANGTYTALDDVWFLQDSPFSDDSTSSWRLLEQIADPVNGLPPPRTRFAAAWAGVEDRAESQLPNALDKSTCYIHGGLDATGQHVLGDLWKGERRGGPFLHYQWVWTLLLPDNASTARYGHTMVFDPGPPRGTANGAPLSGAPYAQLLIFGGRTSTTSPTPMADNTKLYAFGVGSSAAVNGVWRTLSPAGPGGLPPAREGQGMTARWRASNADTRQYFMFGGEDAAGVPVAPDLWRLRRHDLTVADADTNLYVWEKFTPAPNGPAGRTRPALAYTIDAGPLVLVGGDTNGESQPNGLSNEIWTASLSTIVGNSVTWSAPLRREFHPGPPPVAGLTMIGTPGARITRSLETFTAAGTSGPGDGCPEQLAGQWQTVTMPDSLSERAMANYPYMFLLPDGRMFDAGPAPREDPAGQPYKRFFDLGTGRWAEAGGGYNHDSAEFGSAAMYRPGEILRAGTHVEGQSTIHGISNTETISIGAGTMPAWSAYVPGVGKPAMLARTNHNLTLLPTGDVLASGGLGPNAVWPNPDIVNEPQIWSAATGAWNASSSTPAANQFLAPDPSIRNYHSTAILLPDGRILTAGGEKPSPDETSASVYEPPYLFDGDNYATRPDIQDGPETLPYGRTVTITLQDPMRVPTIRSVALMRPGAVTHGFNQNQRYVPLAFVRASNPARLLVQTPANATLAPPGEYMLFVVDSLNAVAHNVPSLAKWVTLPTTSGTFRDSLDVVPPCGPDCVTLTQSDCQYPNLILGWTAPADDGALVFSGHVQSYNLRYALNASAPADFNVWTAVPTGAPSGAAGEQVVVSGLTSNVWYRFALKSTDDNANVSALSNVLVAKVDPAVCGGGGGGGGYHDGDGGMVAGGASLLATPSQDAVTTTQGSENSLFPGAQPGVSVSDALPLAGTPPLADGARRLYVREGNDQGLSLDRARLLAVDHAVGTEVVTAGAGGFLAGVRVPATRVADRSARDVTAEATGLSAEPVYADSGEVLDVTLPPAAENAMGELLVEASAGGSGGGIVAEALDGSSTWFALGRLQPRRLWSTGAVPLASAQVVRLRFEGAYELRFVGRLDYAQPAAAEALPLQSASDRTGLDWKAAASQVDGANVVIGAGDTLRLAFGDLVAPADSTRDWFLGLDGVPVSASVAAFMASRVVDEPAQVTAFRLYQNVPNPFQRATTIRFDLPRAAEARLEIFDPQGRRVWASRARYEPGQHAIEWNLRDGRGGLVSPGIYTYRLRAGDAAARRKMVVIP